MKQKRKVKSLLPQKNDLGGSLLTATLLVLGLALCLGSASLMTSSVGAASSSPDVYGQFDYSGTDDKVEVLYNLQFSDPENLSGFVGEMYTNKNDGFYITSTPITVNESGVKAEDKNIVGDGYYSNILGGHKNKVYSDYITLLGGEENIIAALNPNAVIFGGKNNEISGGASGNPSAIIGGHHNLIKGGHNGNAIIGGNDNSISGSVSNSFILGGVGNKIVSNTGIQNVIVGGSNVTVDTGNVFVFSNSAFKPEGDKTFYLNVSEGLGINTESIGKGVTVNGPVRFGEINIKDYEKYPCNSNNYGVIGSWNGCLVGCTPTTAAEGSHGKWDLLDRGKRCQEACDDESARDYCSQKMPKVKDPESYSGFCTTGVSTENASPCTPVWDEVKDVVFETALINAVQYGGNCPGADATNKCVFQCNSGYYLTGDKTGLYGGETKCYAVCDVGKLLKQSDGSTDWSGVILKHNQTITAYNKEVVPCSYHKYTPAIKFSNDSFGGNFYLDDGYGTKMDRTGAGGLDKSRRYELPEHCGNNAHKQTLVCSSGYLYIANENSSVVSTRKSSRGTLATEGGTLSDGYLGYNHAGYLYSGCTTEQYRCDTSAGNYDINKSYIEGTLEDQVATWGTKDRSKMNGKRGKYQLCLDYNTIADNNEACDPVQKETPRNTHYKFLGCQNGYHQSTRSEDLAKDPKGYLCRKECKVRLYNGEETIWDNTSITLYDRSSAECGKGLCKQETFTCYDGELDKPQGGYIYKACTQKGNKCDGYDVDKTTHDAHTYNSRYNRCEKRMPIEGSNEPVWTYTTFGASNTGFPRFRYPGSSTWSRQSYDTINECTFEERFQLYDCIPCKHTTNGKWCDDADNVSWGSSCSSINGGVVAGYHYNIWTSERYNGGEFKTNYGRCQYYCINGYYDNGSSCSENPKRECEKPEDGSGYYYTEKWSHDATKWYVGYDKKSNESGHVGELLEEGKDWCTHSCRDGYRQVKGNCDSTSEENRGCIGTIPYNAVNIDNDHDDSMYPGIYHHISEGGQDCSFDCPTGYTWNGYACEYDGWNCGKCINTASLDANGGTIIGGVDSVSGPCNTWQTLPQAELACHEFRGWKFSDKPMQVFLDSSKNLVAEWGPFDSSMDGCSTEFSCKGGTPPASPIDRYTTGPIPKYNDMPWTPVDNYDRELNECQWRCNMEYIREGDKCVEVKCKAGDKPGDNPPTKNVDKGPNTYLRTSLTDTNRKWKQGDPSKPCEWKCSEGFELSGSLNAGYECIKSVIAGCYPDNNKPEHYKCIGDSKSINEKIISNGWTWDCQGSSGSVSCFECEEGYNRNKITTTCDVYNCDKNTEPSGEGVVKGPKTYTGVDVADKKTWNYLTGKVAGELNACEWTCMDGFQLNGSKNGCEPKTKGACGEKVNTCETGKLDESSKKTITQGDKPAGWKWDCKGTDSTAHCMLCNTDLGFNESEVNGEKTCAKDVDGECDLTKLKGCSAGNFKEGSRQDYDKQVMWTCEGVGNGKDVVCGLSVDCEGTCNAIGGTMCNTSQRIQSLGFNETNRDHCISAGMYGDWNQMGDFYPEGRCYISLNVFPSMGLNSCRTYEMQNKWFTSCFQWEVGDVICKKLDTSTNGVFVSAEPNTCEAMAGRLPAYCADSEPICKDCETIPVTVMLERTSNEYRYSNFQLISGDGYIAVGTNSGRPCGGDGGYTMACTFDVPAYWNGKRVTMQLQYEYVAGASYGPTTAPVGGENGDWIVNKNKSNLFYYYSPVGAHG